MTEPAKENTLEIPNEIFGKAPGWYDTKNNLWFEKEVEDWHFYVNCERALVVQGIRENECPTIAEWAGFVIAGGIIAALTEKYIVPPSPEPYGWHSDMCHYVWQALWWASRKNPKRLDRAFLAAMLKDFLPRQYYAPPDRPYTMSNFERHWGNLEYADTFMRSTGNLCLAAIKKGREIFLSLPQPIKESVEMAAQHIPMMLKIAVGRIRKTYNW